MYRKVLLAYDGTVEGRLAVREGAPSARICPAEVADHLAERRTEYEAVLADGAQRLEVLGFNPETRLETGDPAQQMVW
jgi:nucleotide-binding universal stress UspA family protein